MLDADYNSLDRFEQINAINKSPDRSISGIVGVSQVVKEEIDSEVKDSNFIYNKKALTSKKINEVNNYSSNKQVQTIEEKMIEDITSKINNSFSKELFNQKEYFSNNYYLTLY